MWSETNQQLTQFAADLLGPEAIDRRATAGPTSCCARAATRSRAAPPRSSRTSSPSACSVCRRRARRRNGLRPDRGPEGDQVDGALAARRAVAVGEGARGVRERRVRRRALQGAVASSAGRASRWPRSTAARGSARSSWPCCSRSWATRSRRRRSCRPRRPRRSSRRTAPTTSARSGCPAWRPASRPPASASRELAADAADAAVIVLIGDDGVAGAARPRATPTSRTARRSTARAAPRASPAATASRSTAPPTAIYAAVAAEVVGLSQRALDMTLEYVKDRKQFGMPSARSRRWRTAAPRCSAMSSRPARPRTSPPGRSTPTRSGCPRRRRWPRPRRPTAARRSTASAIQAHGGIGFTWEADVHWMYKRAQLDARSWAGPAAPRTLAQSPASGRRPGGGLSSGLARRAA